MAYTVIIDARAWEKFRKSSPQAIVRNAERFRDDFLKVSPEDHRSPMVKGKLKPLHGKRAGIFQFDLSDAYRIWYRVDSKNRTVKVEYIGAHP